MAILESDLSTGADRRERLLLAAEELFASTPFEEISVDDIAERAGVAHGLAFHHFGTKQGLFLAALAHGAARRAQAFNANTEPDPGRWLRAELAILLDVVAAEPRVFISILRNSAGTEAGGVLKRIRDKTVERVIAKLAPIRESSSLTVVVSSWAAFANELVAGWLDGGDATREQLEEVLIRLLNSLLSEAASIEKRPAFDPLTFASA